MIQRVATFLLILFCFNSSGQSAKPDSIKSWLTYLASDDLKGRANRSKELEVAQNWVAEKFAEYGVIPLKGQQSLMQEFTLKASTDSLKIRNIIGYLPGNKKNFKDSMIILSAHIDHIGTRKNNTKDSIYNGADDNASGVITLLGIAKNIFEQKIKLKTSIVFVVFSGEELGLIGSGNFCRSKIIPFEKVRLNMNIEMDGRSDQFGKNKYYITGPKKSNLIELLAQFNQNREWQLQDIGSRADMLYRMSDNYSFDRIVNNPEFQVPAHTFATSIGDGYVHQPHDELSFIDFENLNSFVNYLTELTTYLSNNKTSIKYTR